MKNFKKLTLALLTAMFALSGTAKTVTMTKAALLDKIKGTDIEKLLNEYHVI